jgi:hypothetical protein
MRSGSVPAPKADDLAIADEPGRRRDLELEIFGVLRPLPFTAPRRHSVERMKGRQLIGIDVDDIDLFPGCPTPAGAERLMGDELDRLLALSCEARCQAEMIRVTVGHVHRVHVVDGEVHRLQPGRQRVEFGRCGQARIHQRDAAVVHERVAVDVAEPGHLDGELDAQNVGSDLGDLIGRGLLLLLERPGGGRRHPPRILDRPVKYGPRS